MGSILNSYDVILADPPWRYSFSRSKSRRIENQYPTMSQLELCNMQVPAKPNAALYLWATAPKLLEALDVMEAWGFSYKSHAVWDKERVGMGYWFRGQHELLLVGTKGKFSPPPASERVHSLHRERRGRHSAKPTIFHELIERWYPDARLLELFARSQFSSRWDVMGLEAPTASTAETAAR
jgi:N6-adenosine-specific RNA methylase IME4